MYTTKIPKSIFTARCSTHFTVTVRLSPGHWWRSVPGGPFGSFQDCGPHRPLDYRSLEAVIERHPELEATFAHELRPGQGVCPVTEEEIPAARAGLYSSYAFIRLHAAAVLEAHEGKL